MKFLTRLYLALIFLGITIAVGFSQNTINERDNIAPSTSLPLPYHLDPHSKIKAPHSASVPAIRFLSSTDFFPFNYRNSSGRLVGYNIDLSNEICALLDISCTMQAWPWEQIKNALKDNQGDALISGLAINNESANQFDFSNIYLMLPARFIIQKSNQQFFDASDLENKKIAVIANSAHAKYLNKYFISVEQVVFDSELEALKSLQNGETFAYFGDGMRASFWLNENINCCEFTGEAYFNSTYFGEGMSIAFPLEREAVRKAINYSLAQLKRNGKLDELYLRWFPISFY